MNYVFLLFIWYVCLLYEFFGEFFDEFFEEVFDKVFDKFFDEFFDELSFMWLACQKKSYLICDEITNF